MFSYKSQLSIPSVHCFLTAAKMFTRILLIAAVIAFAAADDLECENKDAVVEGNIFKPIRAFLASVGEENPKLPNYDFSLFGFGVKAAGGQFGNISSFHLGVVPKGNSAEVCKNKESNQLTLNINLAYDKLELSFDNLYLGLPVITIGDCRTSFDLKGTKAYIQIGLVQNEKGECSAKLLDFAFRDYGTLTVDFETGVINKLVQYVLNYFSKFVITLLTNSGVAGIISTNAQIFLGPLVREQSNLFCSFKSP